MVHKAATIPAGLARALEVAERAIGLQPVAERVLAACRGDDPAARSAALGADGHQVVESYCRLREELRALRLPGQVVGELDAIPGHHLELVGLALNLTYRPQTPRIQEQRHRLHGLGRSAGDLRALRDRLAAELEADGP
jgi:hypothetical protein